MKIRQIIKSCIREKLVTKGRQFLYLTCLDRHPDKSSEEGKAWRHGHNTEHTTPSVTTLSTQLQQWHHRANTTLQTTDNKYRQSQIILTYQRAWSLVSVYGHVAVGHWWAEVAVCWSKGRRKWPHCCPPLGCHLWRIGDDWSTYGMSRTPLRRLDMTSLRSSERVVK